MRRSIRSFILVLVAVAMVAGFGLLGLAENRTWNERLLAGRQAELTRMVTLLTQAAERKFGPDLTRNEFASWKGTVRELGDYRLSLIDRQGRVVEDSGRPPDQPDEDGDNHIDRPEVAAAFADGLGVSRRYSATGGRDYLYVAGRIVFQREPDALPMVLRLGFPMSLIQAERRAILARYACGAALITLLALALTALVTRPLDREIKELIAAVNDLADGQYARRLVRQPRSELASLGLAFNRLASRVSREATRDTTTRDRLLAVLENMDEGVLVTGQDGRVTNANPALVRLFGLSAPPEGFPGEAIRFPEFIEALSRAGRGEMVPPLVLTLPGPPEKFMEARMRPLGDEYRPEGVVAVFHDLTARQRLYRLRRDIVANVSHELRAPLEALAEAAAILGEKSESDPELKPVALVLERHQGRLDELSRDLLELARLESLKTKALRRETVPTADFLARAAADLAPAGSDNARRLAVAVEPGAETLSVDPGSLTAAIRNLLDNAFKYSAPDSPVSLTVRPGPRGTVELAVANRGPALTPEDLERVFERFYRGEKSRLRSPGGSGLGLAIVKHAAQAHGGTAAVRSAPGEETVFTLTLPRAVG